MPDGDRGGTDPLTRVGPLVLAAGLGTLAASAAFDPTAAGHAAAQVWTPFVLVTGLLLVGLVARGDGLFDAAGAELAHLAPGGRTLLVGAAVLLAAVTAVLNLDTAVVFLTPVVVVAARRRGVDELPFVYLAVFMANGASLLLPGSNLTNLIVLGRHRLAGGDFAHAMLPAWIASVVAVTATVALLHRRLLSAATGGGPPPRPRPHFGAGLAGVAAATVAVLVGSGGVLALAVLACGVALAGWRTARGSLPLTEVRRTLGASVLVGLFGLAVGAGTLGRAWSGPQWLLAHLSSWPTAVVGAIVSVLGNNLPAASLLAARPAPDPRALLVGLDLGPNLAVTGALSAVVWLQAARAVGARPSAARYTVLGLVVVPVSMAAALAALPLGGR
ncbi:MAG: SLC13 family permease [Acidimicrobiales bacterium]